MQRPTRFSISRKLTPGKAHALEFEFDPPLDSDELYDALRLHYPNLNSQQRRVGQAVIDFCLREQQEDQRFSSPSATSSQSFSVGDSPSSSTSSEILLAPPSFVSSSSEQLPSQPSTSQLIEKPLTSRKRRSNQFPTAINSQFKKFRFVEHGKPKPQIRQPRAKPQRDPFGNRKAACSEHHKTKKLVRQSRMYGESGL